MKKITSTVLMFALMAALLSSCGKKADEKPSAGTEFGVRQLAAAVISQQEELPPLCAVDWDDPEFDAYRLIYLGELADTLTGGVICYPFGVYASEVAVFEFSTPDEAQAAEKPLEAYRDERAGAFFGYAPEQSELAQSGVIVSNGLFAALMICPDPDTARESFLECFGPDAPEPLELDDYTDDTPEAPPEQEDGNRPEDEYDHDVVLAAFQTGDASDLTPKNLAIYNEVRRIMDEILTPDMEPWDAERAINDYLVTHADYDPGALEEVHSGTPDPDNSNPYGLLIVGKGICLGYTSTFQLFMDILGIECITVHGYAHGRSEEHAWNMVVLDGDWYCVDVTWNDPVFDDGWAPDEETFMSFYAHSYLNVTSQELRYTDHQWDEDVPEATATKFAYGNW